MNAKVLFTQTHGSVDNETSGDPNGIEVMLTAWDASDQPDWRFQRHYLLRKIVMIDRNYQIDETEVHIGSFQGCGPALEIRKAIDVFDGLLKMFDLWRTQL